MNWWFQIQQWHHVISTVLYIQVFIGRAGLDMKQAAFAGSVFPIFALSCSASLLSSPQFSTGQVNGSLTSCQWARGSGVIAHTATIPFPIRQRCRPEDGFPLCVCVCVCVCVRVCVCACVRACVCVCVCTHLHLYPIIFVIKDNNGTHHGYPGLCLRTQTHTRTECLDDFRGHYIEFPGNTSLP